MHIQLHGFLESYMRTSLKNLLHEVLYIYVCVCVCSWPGGRLSWLPHPTFVSVAIKTTSVIGMKAQAFFSDLSCHIREELREPLSSPYPNYCNRSQCHSEGECSQSAVDTSLVTFDPIYLVRTFKVLGCTRYMCI